MKKQNSKIIIFILLMVSFFTFSCVNEDPIIGTWSLEQETDATLPFSNGQTVTYSVNYIGAEMPYEPAEIEICKIGENLECVDLPLIIQANPNNGQIKFEFDITWKCEKESMSVGSLKIKSITNGHLIGPVRQVLVAINPTK